MDDLVSRIASGAGLGEDQARQAIAVLLNYLSKAAPADRIQPVLDVIPGAADTLEAPRGGLLAGIAGGLGAGGTMGALAALGQLNALGLSMAQVQSAARETIAYARERAGEDAVDSLIGAVPAIRQYLQVS